MTLMPLRQMGRELSPGFLQGPQGERYLWAMTLLADLSQERLFQAVAARFPTQCDGTVLPELAHDRQLIRGNHESDAAFVARLVAWRETWRLAGHAYAILDNLAGYFSPAAVPIRIWTNAGMVYTRAADGTKSWGKYLGTWDWDGETTYWSRFWVVIYPPSSLWTTAPAEGAGPWDLTASKSEVKDVRRIIYQFKPLHARCEWIVVALDPASFTPGALEPDGDWQHWSIGSAPRAANRLSTARYWRGQEVYAS